MAKTKEQRLTELAERFKAKKFVNNYYALHESMPSNDDVKEAKALTPAEEANIAVLAQIDDVVERAVAEEIVTQDYEIIKNEATWNASYENGCLKKYYPWADEKGAYPYKEDLWNEKAQRAANWNDIVKENGEPVKFEDGYHYVDGDGNPCVRCWKGAFYAPGAAYPWCAINTPDFQGTIKLTYNGVDVYPWKESKRSFTRGFAIASIPTEFNDNALKCDFNGNGTFDPSKLVVTLIKMD